MTRTVFLAIYSMFFMCCSLSASSAHAFDLRSLGDFKPLSYYSSVDLFEQVIQQYSEECVTKLGPNTNTEHCFVESDLWQRELDYYYPRLLELLNEKDKLALQEAQLLWIQSGEKSDSIYQTTLEQNASEYTARYNKYNRVNQHIAQRVKARALMIKEMYEINERIVNRITYHHSALQSQLDAIKAAQDESQLKKRINDLTSNYTEAGVGADIKFIDKNIGYLITLLGSPSVARPMINFLIFDSMQDDDGTRMQYLPNANELLKSNAAELLVPYVNGEKLGEDRFLQASAAKALIYLERCEYVDLIDRYLQADSDDLYRARLRSDRSHYLKCKD